MGISIASICGLTILLGIVLLIILKAIFKNWRVSNFTDTSDNFMDNFKNH